LFVDGVVRDLPEDHQIGANGPPRAKRKYTSRVKLSPALCPECGVKFTPTYAGQTFCTYDHRKAFHLLNKVRGQVALPFLLSWRGGKRGRTEDNAYAFQQLCQLADRWREEDKVAGRRSDLIVTKKRLGNWAAVDL
jgi:hypothetical protein